MSFFVSCCSRENLFMKSLKSLTATFALMVVYACNPLPSGGISIGCTFDTEMISDADTLQTPCIVTFRIINGDCSLSAMSTDLVLNGNDDLYTAQVDSPGTYSVFYDDNCGATDCWLQSAEYTFSID